MVLTSKRGQSALEYLMTYGWALIVIVVVIAVLVGMQPKLSVTCHGFGSKTQITTQDFTTTGAKLAVLNGTGRSLSQIKLGGKFTQNGSTYAIASTTPTSGATIDVGGTILQTTNLVPVDGNLTTGNVLVDLNLTYNDGTLPHTDNAQCSGQI